MVLQGSQVQFHSAKQIANSWILHSAAAAACAMPKKNLTQYHVDIWTTKKTYSNQIKLLLPRFMGVIEHYKQKPISSCSQELLLLLINLRSD